MGAATCGARQRRSSRMLLPPLLFEPGRTRRPSRLRVCLVERLESGRGAQHQRHRPQRAQQPPQPAHRQPRQAQPRQPRHPRHPRQATCCKSPFCRSPTFSLSKRWKVARLTSAISSSPRTKRWLGGVFWDCGISAVGVADAVLPTNDRPRPAAPSVVTAARLVLPARFAARFLSMVAVSACW